MGGMRIIVDTIASIVSGITPKSSASIPFILAENDGAHTPDIIANPAQGTSRMFVVRPSDQPAVDDGEAGTPALRLRAIVNVMVIYKYSELDQAQRMDMMQEDVASIMRALQDVNAWDRPTTGILSISPAEQPTREVLDQESASGAVEVGFVLTIPNPVIYREVSL
ncbi:MAG: hypothetical protein COA38_20590 [Fluviicola sp.]|nr:MAG: hypothetical protein COA38_20590 [Fluviicola sp.]